MLPALVGRLALATEAHVSGSSNVICPVSGEVALRIEMDSPGRTLQLIAGADDETRKIRVLAVLL